MRLPKLILRKVEEASLEKPDADTTEPTPTRRVQLRPILLTLAGCTASIVFYVCLRFADPYAQLPLTRFLHTTLSIVGLEQVLNNTLDFGCRGCGMG